MSTSIPVNPPTPMKKAAGIALAAAAVVCLVLLAFSWPAITANPRNIPVGIVGSAEQVAGLEAQMAQQSPDTLKLETYAERDAAVTAINKRDVYGAIVLPTGAAGEAPEFVIATAGNATVAQLLQGMATSMQAQLAAQADVTVTVTDVAPYSPDDPRGAGLSAAALPMVMGGMIGAVLISSAVHGNRRRLVALGIYTVGAGLALTTILGPWFGALQNNFFVDALAVGLSIGAISATIVGLRSLLGTAGLGLGAVLMFFLANPISGAAMPPEFLVGSWGAIGQWFPPGAGQTLIRSLSYFPDASTGFQWSILVGWTALGVALIGLSAFLRNRTRRNVG